MILNVTTENFKDFFKLLCLHRVPACSKYLQIIFLQSKKLHVDISLHRNITNFKPYEPEM